MHFILIRTADQARGLSLSVVRFRLAVAALSYGPARRHLCHGERTAVVLPISDYEKLLEDLEDLAVVAERRGEPTIPHEQFVSELG